ncbi:LytR/AlgR family response regulator transcription factor [Neolewinella antarctica]|uniref:DNA-binding LytR/AlgR family response regulator n=1 Tax=Neolewinella antarctica TaxID=442734 RepID=A0ABX0X7X0_9BACT|nr:LytTR family DNA-binding domain-containing protein [Neolewinella antarctica]NJC25301.1 DNA-binding LytR/AlgR family response regulator [Neolewinella antarctica]
MTKNNPSPDHLFLREGTTYRKVPLDEILFIEADGNYAHVQTTDKRYAVKRSLATIAEKLTNPAFLRVSRGILLNFNRITSLSFADGAVKIGDRELKMGKTYYPDIRGRMASL